jgi:SNF2 family DNA or RNA helicase
MVRKTREDIADQLPNIIHQVIPVPFDTKGAGVYRRIQSDLVDTLSKALRKGGSGFSLWDHYNNDGDGGKEQGEVMTRLTTLRMLCDNPALVRWSSGEYANPDTKHGSEYANTIVNAGIMDGVNAAPKLDAVVDYITEVLAESPDNKVVLFSFFKENLRLIQEATSKITNSVLFMGGMTADEKQDNKNKFQTDPRTRLFLSSDAGGYGVDLPQANYLISYDLPWSSGKLEQREARIIRLSSQWPHVTIATFVMAGSIEERQYQMLQEKLKTNEAFIDGKHHDMEQSFSLTMDNLSTFMRESMV